MRYKETTMSNGRTKDVQASRLGTTKNPSDVSTASRNEMREIPDRELNGIAGGRGGDHKPPRKDTQ